MTGFQRTIASLGGAVGLAAVVLAIGDLGEAGLGMVLGGMILAVIGLRHHAGIDFARSAQYRCSRALRQAF